MKTQKLKKGKIYWIIEEDRIIAFDNLQATSYGPYGINYKKNLMRMRKEVLNSDYGNTWSEVITLAVKNEVYGYSTRLKEEWFDGF